jgi:single-strand DNA-binding protein
MNRAILMGNLGADPELKTTGGGQAVMTFRLATSEKYVDKQGDKQERTDWHRCVMWGTRAEKLAPHLSKGSRVLVMGRVQTREYEKDGEKRYITEINVNDLEFAGGKGATPTASSGLDPPGGNISWSNSHCRRLVSCASSTIAS